MHKILVVDDEVKILKIFNKILAPAGYDVQIATSPGKYFYDSVGIHCVLGLK